jgi:ribosome maturation factor RimP
MFEFIEALLKDTPYDTYHVELKKKKSQTLLIIEIEKAGYINLEDCQIVTRLIEPALENHPTLKDVDLEVASAGAERALTSERHYQNAIGKTLSVHLDLGTVDGTLQAIDESSITVKTKTKEVKIPKDAILKAHLTIVF